MSNLGYGQTSAFTYTFPALQDERLCVNPDITLVNKCEIGDEHRKHHTPDSILPAFHQVRMCYTNNMGIHSPG